jgi:maleate isomerase
VYGWRARLGIIYGVGYTDHEFYLSAPPGVSVHITRATTPGKSMFVLPPEIKTGDAFVHEVARCATDLAKMRPAAIFWGSTSGSFAAPDGGSGRAWDTKLKDAMNAATGVRCTTTSSSVVAGLAALGAKRVAIASPYKPDAEARFAAYLGEHGVSVVKSRGLACEDVWEIGQLPPEVAYRTAMEANHPDADAIVIGETSFRTLEVLEQIEADTGKPVVSASLVSMWNALRIAGIKSPQLGLGRLFREH